ncbi:MAG: hypothetical protein KBG72_10415 [Agrobacterium sp.]|nr:hypothetical protein [Agrobacterium sp.]
MDEDLLDTGSIFVRHKTTIQSESWMRGRLAFASTPRTGHGDDLTLTLAMAKRGRGNDPAESMARQTARQSRRMCIGKG